MNALSRVEAELAARYRRERLFSPALFAEPAWDLLLELYRAYLSGATLSPEELSTLSMVSTAETLRWIGVLEGRGLVSCLRSQRQGECDVITLTPETSESLRRYFEG